MKRSIFVILIVGMLFVVGCDGHRNGSGLSGHEEAQQPMKQSADLEVEPKNLMEATIGTDTPLTEAEAVGKTIENERFVERYSDDLLARLGANTCRGAARIYKTTKFVDGVYETSRNSCLMWYFFDDRECYEKSLTAYLDSDLGDYYLRENNRASYYYAVFQPVGWKDDNGDGIFQYEEAVKENEFWEGDTILIE